MLRALSLGILLAACGGPLNDAELDVNAGECWPLSEVTFAAGDRTMTCSLCFGCGRPGHFWCARPCVPEDCQEKVQWLQVGDRDGYEHLGPCSWGTPQ